MLMGCKYTEKKTAKSNDFEISMLEIKDAETFDVLIKRIYKTKCFTDHSKGRKILTWYFQNSFFYDERDSIFSISLSEDCYGYDASELKAVYGGIWLQHENDSLLLMVMSDSVASNYFKKTDKTIDVEKYGENTLEAYEIIWFFKYIENDFVLFSESCYRIE